MHEYGLACDILEAALRAAGPNRVARVYVDAGPQTHADPAVLADAFEIAAAGTLASGAIVEVTPADAGGVAVTAIDVDATAICAGSSSET